MKKFILIMICFCGSVIFFSQQSVAGPVVMSPSVFASTFNQTGYWWATSINGTCQSINWPNSSFNSWINNSSISVTGSGVTGGAPSDYYYTIDFTFGPGVREVYYNGTEYVVYTSGTGTDILHYVSGILDPSGSSLDLVASPILPIYLASDSSFTGFYVNDSEIKGNVTFFDGTKYWW